MKKIIALFAMLLSTQVFAANDAMLQLLNTLKERGTLDPVAYESLAPLEKEFMKMVLSKTGQEIVVKDGYVPLPAKVAQKAQEWVK